MSINPEDLKIQSQYFSQNINSINTVSVDEISAFDGEFNLDKTDEDIDFSSSFLVSELTPEQTELIIDELYKQYEQIEESMATAKDNNGWISGTWNWIKNKTGIGASSDKADAKIKNMMKQLEELKKNPENLASTYANLMGKELTDEELTKFINGEVNLINDSEAGQSVNKYTEGQKMCVDVIADIVSGIVAVGAVALAPVTGGLSLAALAIGAGAGAVVKVALKASDCAGNNKKYTLKDFGYDLITGSVNGAMGPVTNALGGATGTAVMKAFGMEALETTVKSAAITGTKEIIEESAEAATKNTLKTLFKKGIAKTADFAVDGTFSGATDGFARAIGEGRIEDVPEEMFNGAVGGLIFSPLIGGSMNLAGKVGSKFAATEIGQSITRVIKEGSDDVGKVLSDITPNAVKNTFEQIGENINSKLIAKTLKNAVTQEADGTFNVKVGKYVVKLAQEEVTGEMLKDTSNLMIYEYAQGILKKALADSAGVEVSQEASQKLASEIASETPVLTYELLVKKGFSQEYIDEAKSLGLSIEDTAVYSSYRAKYHDSVSAQYQLKMLKQSPKEYDTFLQYAREGLNNNDIRYFKMYNVPVSKAANYKLAQSMGISDENIAIKMANFDFDKKQIKKYLKLISSKNKTNIPNEDAVQIVYGNFDKDQMARYFEVKEKYLHDYQIGELVRLNFTDEEIAKYHRYGGVKKFCHYEPEVARLYFDSCEVLGSEILARTAIESGYTKEEIEKMAKTFGQASQIDDVLKSKRLSTVLKEKFEISYKKKLHSNYYTISLYDLKDQMIKDRIFDVDDFCRYLEGIDTDKLSQALMKVDKDFYASNLIQLLCYHYKQGTPVLDEAALSLDGEFTSFLMNNYLNANGLNDLLNVYPLTQRNVGELPTGWISGISPEKQAEVSKQIYDAITEFQTSKGAIKNSSAPDPTELQERMSEILGKSVTIKYAGAGELGVAYKISVEGSDPMCLKVFYNQSLSGGFAYNKHGEHIEPQVALFANQHSNKFVKMYFGRVSRLSDRDGFMVTQFIEDGIIPEKTGVDTQGYKFYNGDDHSGNSRGGKIIDFGAAQIYKDGERIDDWGY